MFTCGTPGLKRFSTVCPEAVLKLCRTCQHSEFGYFLTAKQPVDVDKNEVLKAKVPSVAP